MTMRATREKLFREVLAAILSSKLRLPELRQLADRLGEDSGFSRDLARAIWNISSGMADDVQEQLFVPEDEFMDQGDSGRGISELAYTVVQRRRLSKTKLLSLLSDVAPRMRWTMADHDLPVKEILRKFFDRASTSEAQKCLNVLGMDVAQDPFLGGISDRLKK